MTKRVLLLICLVSVGIAALVLGNEVPVARFSFSSGGKPYTVLFDASESYDPDGTITSYQWTFGDGYSGAGKSVSHVYSGAGNFQVTLVVFDDASAPASITQTVSLSVDGTVVPSAPSSATVTRANVPVGLGRGQAAPEFTLPDAAGKEISLSDFLGKVVILEFWLSTCPHCRETMPHLQELFDRYKDDGLVVVLVALDRSMSVAQGYLDANGYSDFINLWDDPNRGEKRVADIYKVWFVPHTLLIDRHGVIRYSGYPSHLLDSDIAPWLH